MTADTRTIDPKAAKLCASVAVPGTLFAMALDEPRRVLYGAGTDGALHAVDLAAEKLTAVRKWTLHENYVSSLALRGDTLSPAAMTKS
ncbi:MAG: hypothetical protein U0792_21405 [Gemmataceae bacterium]